MATRHLQIIDVESEYDDDVYIDMEIWESLADDDRARIGHIARAIGRLKAEDL